jgi:hypothetical protein
MTYALTNPLCSLADVKAALGGISDTVDDDRISLSIDAASRLIEKACGRRFYQDAGVSARTFVATSWQLTEIDDLATTTGLIVQTDYAGDGTFGTTWQAADYQLEPLNAQEYESAPWPYTKIRAIRSLWFPVWGGISYPAPYTQALIKVTAKWGWPSNSSPNTPIPPDVYKAAVLQSIALFKSDDVPFGATPFGETGILRLRQALHPTAQLLLGDFMLDPVLVA